MKTRVKAKFNGKKKEEKTKMNVKSSLINYWRPLIHGISVWIKKEISSRIKKGSAKNRRKFQTKFNTPSCAWETQKRTRLSRKKMSVAIGWSLWCEFNLKHFIKMHITSSITAFADTVSFTFTMFSQFFQIFFSLMMCSTESYSQILAKYVFMCKQMWKSN